MLKLYSFWKKLRLVKIETNGNKKTIAGKSHTIATIRELTNFVNWKKMFHDGLIQGFRTEIDRRATF
jgi:hypothetical protein